MKWKVYFGQLKTVDFYYFPFKIEGRLTSLIPIRLFKTLSDSSCVQKYFNFFLVCRCLVSNVYNFEHFRLLGTVSTDSVRCSHYISNNESDLRISSIDNTCTDSLVTALDDEALLICDAASEMARTKAILNSWKHTFAKCFNKEFVDRSTSMMFLCTVLRKRKSQYQTYPQ